MTTPAQSGSFDEYAHDYDRLLDDPLRKRFAGDNAFFIRQKCRAMLRALERHMPVDRRWRVLDAGCGQGAAFEFLRDSCDVVGVDVSIPMLRVAAEKGPVVAQEPFDLPFGERVFDAAFAFCVYHHIDPAHRVEHLREIARVVRPGGLVFVFEHNPLNPVTRRVFNRAPVDRGCRMIPRNQLRKVFTDAGLTDVRHGYVLFVPEFLDRIFDFLEQRLEWLPLGGQYFVAGRATT